MHRFFVPDARHQEVVTLPEAEALHATRVLRLAPGESVTLLDGAGGEHTGELLEVRRHHVAVRIQSRRTHPARTTELTLIQAVAKGPAMEGVVHRAVELGCHRLVPLVTDRSVSRPDSAEDKQARWQGIAVEAAKQSGNPWRMTVEPPQSVAQWRRQREPFDLLAIASLENAPVSPRDRWMAYRAVHQRGPRTVGIIIGPEGDLTPEEYAHFRDDGAQSFTLGAHVLRVETAAIAALAVWQSLLESQGPGTDLKSDSFS
ncbi:MAG: 16S rRNA (uracil(1498)-N(3))-methyltransferase [Verrucomicrobia bacterium]|nr:16S rRNA (uracil(1498)-N(3))-methyltransferase [Verrucomicrobiota bacterium]